MKYNTSQENFWAGKFGDDYTIRNNGAKIEAASIALFSSVIRNTSGIHSALEIGSNRGINLKALNLLLPNIQMEAIEINEMAARECSGIQNVTVFNGSVFDYPITKQFDLSFTCGVLIHISPEKISDAYSILYNTSKKYIMIAEYYNPTPVTISYRGNEDKLFKRDFAGEILDKYDDLSLVDYGFLYHRDHNFPSDDISWFLMKKHD